MEVEKSIKLEKQTSHVLTKTPDDDIGNDDASASKTRYNHADSGQLRTGRC